MAHLFRLSSVPLAIRLRRIGCRLPVSSGLGGIIALPGVDAWRPAAPFPSSPSISNPCPTPAKKLSPFPSALRANTSFENQTGKRRMISVPFPGALLASNRP